MAAIPMHTSAADAAVRIDLMRVFNCYPPKCKALSPRRLILGWARSRSETSPVWWFLLYNEQVDKTGPQITSCEVGYIEQ